jgi:hypothetical protein
MRYTTILFAIVLGCAATFATGVKAAEARHFSFAYDQPHSRNRASFRSISYFAPRTI